MKNAACLAFAVAGCYKIVSVDRRALMDLPEEVPEEVLSDFAEH